MLVLCDTVPILIATPTMLYETWQTVADDFGMLAYGSEAVASFSCVHCCVWVQVLHTASSKLSISTLVTESSAK